MYAYCSLGSSLRSFLVINIVRKGFRVPFWNCFGAKPAVLRIRLKYACASNMNNNRQVVNIEEDEIYCW